MAHFHSLVNNGIISWDSTSSMNKVFVTQKKILYTMLGISSRSSCRKWFKKLEILPILSLSIHSLMLFVVDNKHYFQTDSSVHEINSRYQNHLPSPSVRLAAVRRSSTCSAVRIFNKLPHGILELKNDKIIFMFASKKYLLTCFLFRRRIVIKDKNGLINL